MHVVAKMGSPARKDQWRDMHENVECFEDVLHMMEIETDE